MFVISNFYRTKTEAGAVAEPLNPGSVSVTILNCITPIFVGVKSNSNFPSANEVVLS
jgi:hypothetical protein